MSKTGLEASRIKDALEQLKVDTPKDHELQTRLNYILHRLWPELEAAIRSDIGDIRDKA